MAILVLAILKKASQEIDDDISIASDEQLLSLLLESSSFDSENEHPTKKKTRKTLKKQSTNVESYNKVFINDQTEGRF